MSEPITGDRYRHYKGGLYTVICLAIDEPTLTPVVVYQSLKNGTIWARSVEVWKQLVHTEDGLAERFARVNQTLVETKA